MTDLRHAGAVRVMRSCAIGLAALALVLSSCNKSTPTAPNNGGSGGTGGGGGTATVTLSGTVTDAASGAAISGAAVAIGGKNAATASDGKYSIAGLTAGSASLTVQHQGHNNFSQSVTLSGTTATTDVKMTPARVAQGAGNWSGTWHNTTFGSSGTMTVAVSGDTIAQTARLTVDVNGNVFGAGDPPSETFNGSYTPGQGGTVNQTSTRFGNVSVTFNPNGSFTGTCTNIPASGISRFDFTGSMTTSTMNLTYTVTFTSGAPATGTATLTRH
jgi:hypothetical protein